MHKYLREEEALIIHRLMMIFMANGSFTSNIARGCFVRHGMAMKMKSFNRIITICSLGSKPCGGPGGRPNRSRSNCCCSPGYICG